MVFGDPKSVTTHGLRTTAIAWLPSGVASWCLDVSESEQDAGPIFLRVELLFEKAVELDAMKWMGALLAPYATKNTGPPRRSYYFVVFNREKISIEAVSKMVPFMEKNPQPVAVS